GRKPGNSFSLTLDFSKPPLLDVNNAVSSPTPNRSQLFIEGNNDAWVATIADHVMSVISSRQNKRGWLHKAFIYDVGLYLIGFPMALYACWKSSDFVNNHPRNGS